MRRVKKALLIVDVQNDFCPGGALAVPEAERIIPILNKYINLFLKFNLPIFACRDWHPKETKHFKRFGGLWPEHCLANSKGAMFYLKLRLPQNAMVLSKGMDPEKKSYSAFQAIDSNGAQFYNLLNIFEIKEVFVGGLATDYCVKCSVLDALKFGFKVKLLTDAIKGVDVKKGDSEAALAEMASLGAKKVTLEKVARSLEKKSGSNL